MITGKIKEIFYLLLPDGRGSEIRSPEDQGPEYREGGMLDL